MSCKSEWVDQAYWAATKALRYVNRPFLAEELYQKILKYVEEAPDARAMGGVIRKLNTAGVIHNHGFRAAKTSNGSIKNLWMKS